MRVNLLWLAPKEVSPSRVICVGNDRDAGRNSCYQENGNTPYFHQAEWAKLKKQIQEAAGLRFKWKDFRSTFAQTCIDNGAKVESVSRLLGHSSTKTTEAYYGRIRNDRAMEEVAQALEKQATPIVVKA